MIGRFAYSKAGHDKGTLYLIVREEGEYVFLCDGRLRTMEHPKRKSKKHIQPIYRYEADAAGEKLREGIPVRDEEIKRAIKVFQTLQNGGRNV